MTMLLRSTFAGLVMCVLVQINALAAPQAQEEMPAPIYNVTVISRGLEAVNYQNRRGPTKIDFRGTVLLPNAHGEATVESKKGRIEIETKFDHLTASQRFGREYLTYVLWAVTPEGRAINLGEVVPSASDRATVRVTTDLPVFGLIVTAEPYFTVSQPSDVVVLQNQIRPDSGVTVQQVHAQNELLPRNNYTYQVPSSQDASVLSNAPKVSMDQYEALLQLYQAQNAVQLAESAGASRYAPETYNKAVQLLKQAQDSESQKKGTRSVVTAARAATEAAEDAREVALKRHDEKDEKAVAGQDK